MKDSLPVARRTVTRYLQEAGFPEPPLADVRLALTEAIANTIVHAYIDDPPSGDVRVQVALSADELLLTVEDDGRGLKPRPDTPGMGLGLQLMGTLAQRLDASPPDVDGTRVAMVFRLDRPAKDDLGS